MLMTVENRSSGLRFDLELPAIPSAGERTAFHDHVVDLTQVT